MIILDTNVLSELIRPKPAEAVVTWVVISTSDTTTFTLTRTGPPPLTGGNSAVVVAAANRCCLVIGTSLTSIPVEVTKRTLAITKLTIISQAPTSITADNYGYLTVTSPFGFFIVGPDGTVREYGGGSPFTVNTLLGVKP